LTTVHSTFYDTTNSVNHFYELLFDSSTISSTVLLSLLSDCPSVCVFVYLTVSLSFCLFKHISSFAQHEFTETLTDECFPQQSSVLRNQIVLWVTFFVKVISQDLQRS